MGDYIDGIGKVVDPDDEEMVALMENVVVKDDTDYVKGSDEVKRYDLIEKPTSDLRCAFCGGTREEVAYLVQSPMGPCICDMCVITAINLMLGKRAEK